MGRPSLRELRRGELALACVRAFARDGRQGASIAAIAAEAGVAPGLVHHYFVDQEALYAAALELLVAGLRQRLRGSAPGLDGYIDATLALDQHADTVAARAWVGLLAEALSRPALFAKARRLVDAEIAVIERRGALPAHDASGVLAYVLGALMFGAFAPRKAAGFAAPTLRSWLRRRSA